MKTKHDNITIAFLCIGALYMVTKFLISIYLK